MLTRCPRREWFQIRCNDPECEQCMGIAMDLGDVTTIYEPVLVAIQLLQLLPHKKDRIQELDSKTFGKVLPMDVDFAEFTTHTGMYD